MKKTKSLLFAFLILILAAFPVSAATETTETTAAASENPTVYLTVSDDMGRIVLAAETIEVTDRDGDGKLTANDALLLASETKNLGDYAYKKRGSGYEITKLLGKETNGAYEVYIDGTKMSGGGDYLVDGDFVQVFFYTDTAMFTDRFAYFTKNETTLKNGDEDIKLFAYEKTAEGNLMAKPVAGAEITVNGEKTGIHTDKNGAFTLSVRNLDKGQRNVISAVSDDIRMVPPVLIATPGEDAVPSMRWGTSVVLPIAVFFGVIAIGMAVFLLGRKKKK